MNETPTLVTEVPRGGHRLCTVMLVALLVFALDQGSKYWMLEIFGIAGKTPVVVNDYFTLVLAWNTGVSFSMFAHGAPWMPMALTALAVGISALLLRLALRSAVRLERVAYAIVIGGALGNAIDRIRFGAVADFFFAHVGAWGWPAFNVADMAICVGVGLLLFSVAKPPARP